MLGKIVGSVMGARIAENAGKSGAIGGVAGYVASRLVRRSPIGALVLGGAWLGHKLYKRNQERKFNAAADTAKPVRRVEPDTPTADAAVPPKVPSSAT
ncbi:MAG: hypothetical protein AB7U35_11615 [Sphingobium sp.]